MPRVTVAKRARAAYQIITGESLPFPSKLKAAARAMTMSFSGRGVNSYGWGPMDGRVPGSDINYRTAIGDPLRSSLIMPIIKFHANAITEAPTVLFETDRSNADTMIKDHPMLERLRKPNDFYDGDILMSAYSISWLLDGNVYWYIGERDRRGRPASIWYIPHFLIEPRGTTDNFITHYEYRPGHGPIYKFDPDDIIHFRDGLDPRNPLKGLSGFGALLVEIFTDNQRALFSAALLRNLGVPPFILMPKEMPKSAPEGHAAYGTEDEDVDIDIEAIKKAVMKRTTGDRRGEPLALTGPVEVKQLGFNPKQMDLSALVEVPESRVAAAFNLPPVLLGYLVGLKHSTARASYKESREQATESNIIPTWGRKATTLTHRMLPLYEDEPRLSRMRVGHDISQVRVLQEDEDKKAKRDREDFQAGGITRAEFRQKRGLTFDKQKDDVYLIPSNVMVVDSKGVAVGTPAEA